MKKVKAFFASLIIIAWRILLVPLGIGIFFLGFFDDRASGLLFLSDKLSVATHLPHAIFTLALLVVWLALKAGLFMTGTSTIMKSFYWNIPFWEIWNSIGTEPETAH